MTAGHGDGRGSVDLRIRGGTGGVSVGLDSLAQASRVLAWVAQEAAAVVGLVARGAADADVVAGALLSPATGAVAEEALLAVAGPLGLGAEVAALVELAATVRAAVETYRAGEAAVSVAVERSQDAVLCAAGRLVPELLVGVLTLDALGVDVPTLLDRAVFEHPEIADVAGGAEGLVLGLRSNPVTAPLVRSRPRPEEPGDPSTAGPSAVDGRDRDYERGVQTLADSAAVWGLLDDRGRAQVTAEPSPRSGARPPRSLRDLAEDQGNVGNGEEYAGHVRVIEVPQRHGSAWVVEISGTQEWDPHAGETPFDLTTDVRSMAQEGTVLADAVQQALAQAQVDAAARSSGDPLAGRSGVLEPGPVMLVGHSLGGIAAAGLASSPSFTARQQVTHVVTMGSPVGRMPVPPTVHVLSLEHARDAVPRLDGQANPDRATWVTVTRDAHDGGVDRASQTHDLREYVETASLADRATDPSVVDWRSSSAAFFAGEAHGEPVIRDYVVRRVRP